MRKGYGLNMKLLGLLLTQICAFAAVDGVVMNGSTGKPAAAVVVSLVQPSASGMQTIASVKSGADGKFRIDKEYPPGPALLQGLHGGASYPMMLTPGSPTTGLTLVVFDPTTKPEAAKVAQHMILIEPTASALQVSETFICQNDTHSTYVDPTNGSLQFYLPDSASANARVSVTAPGGMPIQRAPEKTGKSGLYKINYPIKPGETRFDLTYTAAPSTTFSGKKVDPSTPTRMVTPASVTLSGDGLDALGQEPQTQAHIYSVTSPTYEVKIEGTGSLRPPETGGQPEEDTGEPPIEVKPSQIYSRLYWVLGLTLAILGLGGVMLYRKGSA
jgi:hypothetical protein